MYFHQFWSFFRSENRWCWEVEKEKEKKCVQAETLEEFLWKSLFFYFFWFSHISFQEGRLGFGRGVTDFAFSVVFLLSIERSLLNKKLLLKNIVTPRPDRRETYCGGCLEISIWGRNEVFRMGGEWQWGRHIPPPFWRGWGGGTWFFPPPFPLFPLHFPLHSSHFRYSPSISPSIFVFLPHFFQIVATIMVENRYSPSISETLGGEWILDLLPL